MCKKKQYQPIVLLASIEWLLISLLSVCLAAVAICNAETWIKISGVIFFFCSVFGFKQSVLFYNKAKTHITKH